MAVNASAVWRVRPSGSNVNGGGYDAAISGAGTDYSQQNAAQASGSAGTAAATPAFSDTVAAAFTSAMVGNAIWIASGSGFTAGAYFVTAFTDSSHITLDRSPGTGSAAVWKLGGGWADFWTNTTSTATWVKGGNIIYILGGASPSIASPDYAPTTFFAAASTTAATGPIRFVGDPNTPGSNGFSGKPLVKGTGLIWFNNNGPMTVENIYLTTSAATQSSHGMLDVKNGVTLIKDVVFDQNGWDIGLAGGSFVQNTTKYINVEVFSSVAKRSTNVNAAIITDHFGGRIINCNIHDCIGPGIQCGLTSGGSGAGLIHIENTIIAKNGGDGVKFNTFTFYPKSIINCTIDGNAGHGINFADFSDLSRTTVMNNLITNHTGASKFGINVANGSAAANTLYVAMIDYNLFYGNTTDLSNLNYGTHDTHGGSDPYNAQSTEDYSLVSGITYTSAAPGIAFLQHLSGKTATVQNYLVQGAVQSRSLRPSVLSYTNAFTNSPFSQHKASQTTTVQGYVYPGATQPQGSATYSASLAETGAAADTPTATTTANLTISESGSAADSPTVVVTFAPSLAEGGTGSDALTPAVTFNAGITEAGTASCTLQQGYFLTLSEAGNAAENLSVAVTFNSTITEIGAAQDSPTTASCCCTSSVSVSDVLVSQDQLSDTVCLGPNHFGRSVRLPWFIRYGK